jgi:hypothetical protein
MTPATFWASARISDRHGPLTVQTNRDGRTMVLVDTKGRLVPDVALELDAAGRVVGKTLLDRFGREVVDDLDDLGEEDGSGLLQPPTDMEALAEGARLARRCSCQRPWPEDQSCGRCGYELPHMGLAA